MWPCVQSVVYLNGLKFLRVSHHFAKFRGYKPCGSSDTAARIIYMTLQDYVIKGSGNFMEGNSSLYIPTLPKLIDIDNRYIIILVCSMILEDHLIIWSCDFMGRMHSR